MKYRKKPVEIEARQYDGNNRVELEEWVRSHDGVTTGKESTLFAIVTLEGVMRVKRGDYVIRGVQGEFYPCKPDIFESTYEQVN